MGKYFEDIEIGSSVSSSRITVTETHIVLFSGLTGDFNALHTDATAVKEMKFGRIIAHGMLCASISCGLRSGIDDWQIVAMMETRRRFRKPVFAGDTVSFTGEVIARNERSSGKAGEIILKITMTNQDKAVVLEGEDTILVSCRKEGSQ
ncbi:MaoC family dehydratase [Sinorhizobium meliloti]|uniref:MaoC family dehydratase n=1 Tax=Rhizobium meliloti TaxID=382 RepID=UPI003D65D475